MNNNVGWQYIPFRKDNGAMNMAIDEYILEKVISNDFPNTLRFYQWSISTASIGRNQSLSTEIDLFNAKKYDVDVVRRITGGGAVYHDSINEITYSLVINLDDIPDTFSQTIEFDSNIPRRYQYILQGLANGLNNIGVSVDSKRIHCPALLMDGKKISGNAQIIRKNVLLQHGTILLDIDPEFMYQILKAPEGVTNSKMVQSVRSKVDGIKNEISFSLDDLDSIVNGLKNGFQDVFNTNLVNYSLSHEEVTLIKNTTLNLYTDENWLKKFK